MNEIRNDLQMWNLKINFVDFLLIIDLSEQKTVLIIGDVMVMNQIIGDELNCTMNETVEMKNSIFKWYGT